MFNYLLLFLSVCASVAYSTTRSVFSKKYMRSFSGLFMFNAAGSLLSAFLMTLAAAVAHENFSSSAIINGCVFGIMMSLASIVALKAFQSGPLSYTTVITSFAMVFPSLSGALFWNEEISKLQYAGMALILVSVFFAVNLKKNGDRKASFKWIIYCFATLVLNGSVSVHQKYFKTLEQSKDGTLTYLAAGFAASTAFAFLLKIIADRNAAKKKDKNNVVGIFSLPDTRKRITAFTVLCGSTTVLANVINMQLVGVMNSAVLFPLLNGGGLYVITMVSVFFLKEKLSIKQWAGLAAGFAAILLLTMG